MTVFLSRTLPELGKAIRSGEVSPVELAEQAIAALETTGRALNAVVTVTNELALAQARLAEHELSLGIDRGPLHGIPYGAKDLLATAGIPTTWGAAPFRNQTFEHDAAVIEKLREAGAVLVSKLAMVELAGGFGYDHADAALTGPGLNAWSREAWAGGSSSGSGAAVGAGLLPFAIGTETWGSIHIPSAFNGVTGLRPTYGRVSRRGAMALSWSMDKIGPMARTARDCETILAAIAGPDPADRATLHGEPIHGALNDRPKIGINRHALANAQSEVVANFDEALKVLAQFADLDEIEIPNGPWDEAAGIVITAEAASAFEEFMASGDVAGLTSPEDRVGLFAGLTLPAVDYLRALRIRAVAGRQMDALLAGVDAVVAPSCPHVAAPIDKAFSKYFDRDERRTLGGLGNLLGLPSISVPMGFGERGLPTGLEILSRAYREGVVVALAVEFQKRTDWHLKIPTFA
jgi:aspartyl-tRNA(Asn)/glutamyl-tRNA(Gln) amidotransferase subunit A